MQNPLCAHRKLVLNEFYVSVIKVKNTIEKKLHIADYAGATTIYYLEVYSLV
jgi:hypothetical protein